jgi:hypothetical protein
MKRHYGQLKDSEAEAEKDLLNSTTGGLTLEEYKLQENG